MSSYQVLYRKGLEIAIIRKLNRFTVSVHVLRILIQAFLLNMRMSLILLMNTILPLGQVYARTLNEGILNE